MFSQILVFSFKINDVLEIRQVLPSIVSFRWFTVLLMAHTHSTKCLQ